MKISIITICFNNVEWIEETLSSVIAQSDVDVECVVQDGGSTDGTRQVIERLSTIDPRIRYESLPDDGIYDALNRALARCSGDLIGFVHAGDFLCNSSVLCSIASTFEEGSVDLVYGNKRYCDEVDVARIVRYWKSRPIGVREFRNGEMPPHQATYFRRNVYAHLGGFRTDMSIAADYEWLLRAIVCARFEAKYVNLDVITMRNNGVSNNSLANMWASNKQAAMAWKVNGQQSPFMFLARKIMRKIPQLWSRPINRV